MKSSSYNDITSCVNFFSHGIGQNLPHYIMMCLVYTTWMSCRGVGNGLISVIKARGFRYLLVALIDVEACTLITSAHQFTSIAGIQVRGNDVTWDLSLCQTTMMKFSTVFMQRISEVGH